MPKRAMALLLCLLMVFSLVMTTYAAEPVLKESAAPNTPTIEAEEIIVLNDPILVAQHEEFLNIALMSSGMTLKNRVRIGEGYYDDLPFIVDSIEGPMASGPEVVFEEETTGGFNGDFGVTVETIKVSFGVNISNRKKVTRTYKFDPIPAGKILVYEGYTNYTIYEFDVYKNGIYMGKSKYWVPIGIVVRHHLE